MGERVARDTLFGDNLAEMSRKHVDEALHSMLSAESFKVNLHKPTNSAEARQKQNSERSAPVCDGSFDLVEVKQESDGWLYDQHMQRESMFSPQPAHSQNRTQTGKRGMVGMHQNQLDHHSTVKRQRFSADDMGCEEQALCLKKVCEDVDNISTTAPRKPQQAHTWSNSFQSFENSLTSHSQDYSDPRFLPWSSTLSSSQAPLPNGSMSQRNSSRNLFSFPQNVLPRTSPTVPTSPQQNVPTSPRSQQVTSSPNAVRSNTSSPATQPSSTTDDLDFSSPLDPRSVSTLITLAGRHSALELLSKKSQRSSPNPAQKLGSILIRSAAQTAGLWETTPLLRHIPEGQRHCFLSAVYQVNVYCTTLKSCLPFIR
jgi:hypothetical protein